MPKTAWLKEDPAKEHYWGAKRGRIDLTRDENGNWFEASNPTGERYDTFDISRTPVLLLSYIPVCPECSDKVFMGFFNYEKDQEGKGGFAFRHVWHFWYEDVQMWGYPPPVRPSRNQPGIQSADVPETETISSSYEGPMGYDDAYEKGKEAFIAGVKEWNNPLDGRTGEGRAWYRGWREAKREAESASQAQGDG